MIRVLHFSDVHLPSSLRRVPMGDLAGKRLLGAANVIVRRRRRFREAPAKMAALARLARELPADAVLCTGDYTELGTEEEIQTARVACEPFLGAPLGFITMPGNHDLYVPDTVRTHRFERHFGDLLRTDLPEHAIDGPWPSVRLLGDHAAVVAVRSARPNPEPWRSSGAISAVELGALAQILADPRVRDRFIVVATHYALRRRDGTRDTRLHGLDNTDALERVCASIARGAIVHGHIHWRYHLRLPGLRAHVLGAGSATDRGREGLWVYELDRDHARAIPGSWRDGAFALDPTAAVDLG